MVIAKRQSQNLLRERTDKNNKFTPVFEKYSESHSIQSNIFLLGSFQKPCFLKLSLASAWHSN